MIAADLIAWLRLLALPEHLVTAEPKALRYRLLHVPARLTRSAPRRTLRLPATWPWVDDLVGVFARIAAIPQPA
jgi:Transposase DDE domain group 1